MMFCNIISSKEIYVGKLKLEKKEINNIYEYFEDYILYYASNSI